mmetsp:Transcript_113769/g.179022  ORF Transcript_113769/g.179022 Transcript_113769/m.179022 type:complete len:211 (-) Transcript_113769:122-754(-)
MTGFEASPSTFSTSSTEIAPPATSILAKGDWSLSWSVLLAISVTSLSSHVPAAFQTAPSPPAFGFSTMLLSAGSSICLGLNSSFFSGFHSRCLYQVRLSSLSSMTFSSAFCFFVSSFASFLACFSCGLAFGFGSSGFLQLRLWKLQSLFWHSCEQYDTFLHLPHSSGFTMSFMQLWQCGFSGVSTFLLASVEFFVAGFSSSESTILSNLE